MKIVVCDDENLARALLVRIIEQSGHTVVAQAKSGREALKAVAEYHPDVLLLDIRMPEMDGIECATELNKMAHPPAIIFVTAFDEYAITAFQTNAIAYLLKPAKKQDLLNALDKASHLNAAQMNELAKLNNNIEETTERNSISARTHKGIEIIQLEDIYYFTADQKYVKVRHKKGVVLIDDTLKEIEQEFDGKLFRIHRNALINVDYLKYLEMVDAGQYQVGFQEIEDTLAVSRRHVPTLRERMKNN